MSAPYLHLAAVLLYLVAAILSLARLFVSSKERLDQIYLTVMAAAFLLHTGLLTEIALSEKSLPLGGLFGILLVLAWCLVFLFFLSRVISRISILSFFLTPLVLVLVGWAYLHGNTPPWLPKQARELFWFHILFSVLGLAGLVLGVVFAWMYELQERALRTKSRSHLSRLLPSLETCDRQGQRTLAGGFVLYTLGILHAALFSLREKGTWAELSTKELGSILVWIIFAVLLQARLLRGPRGRSYAILGSAGLLAIILTLAGIR